MTTPIPSSYKWSLRKRLEYIDFRLFWDGRFNRGDLANEFDMSAQQASADVATYQKHAPDNLIYDAAQKAYVRAEAFRPLLAGESSDGFLLQLIAIKRGWMDQGDTWFQTVPPAVEIVALPRAATNPDHLLAVLDAIRGRSEIDVDYRSLTGTPASWRGIAPHAMASCAGRWYVRAWSRDHDDFRDYNLNRIRGVRDPRPSPIDHALDYEWAQKIDLKVIPHPDLDDGRRAAIEEEYEMTGGRLIWPVRLSLSFYLMAANNLDVKRGDMDPLKQQLLLENREDVVAARRLAHDMAAQALQRAAAT